MSNWELDVALDLLGLDAQQQQTVKDAIPLAAKLLDHIEANKRLFATLYADINLILPAAQIILDALDDKGYTFESFITELKGASS